MENGWTLALVWVACVILGAVAGFFAGYLLWKLGFELIGSAVALVGAGLGGILAFFGFLSWSEDHQTESESQ
jgi:ABC-type xylose transport system permease subunit